jgi:hypothetical protein
MGLLHWLFGRSWHPLGASPFSAVVDSPGQATPSLQIGNEASPAGSYLKLIAKLPLPTASQTDRFADHVVDNHSWYKHLPFFPPGASFVFFLNPHAGRGVREAGGVFTVYDVKRGDYFQHHSRLRTAEYLSRFGHWDYWVDENPRDPGPREGPFLYGVGTSGREPLPEDVRSRWRGRFTAFLKPVPPMFALCMSAWRLRPEAEAFRAYARRCQADPAVARYRPLAREVEKSRLVGCGNEVLSSFMEAEGRVQKEQLLRTLQMIREACGQIRRNNG